MGLGSYMCLQVAGQVTGAEGFAMRARSLLTSGRIKSLNPKNLQSNRDETYSSLT